MTAASSQLLALAAFVAVTTSVRAEPRQILDYRQDPASRSITYPAAVRAALGRAVASRDPSLAKSLGERFVILGSASGAFSAAGRKQDLYLLARSGPVAADPFPDTPQVLVALERGEAAGIYALATQPGYQRVAGTVDRDGDGLGEVLLETASYNMGQSVTSLDVVSLASPGRATIRQRLVDVASDSCENSTGPRSRSASTIHVGPDGSLVAKPHALSCR